MSDRTHNTLIVMAWLAIIGMMVHNIRDGQRTHMTLKLEREILREDVNHLQKDVDVLRELIERGRKTR